MPANGLLLAWWLWYVVNETPTLAHSLARLIIKLKRKENSYFKYMVDGSVRRDMEHKSVRSQMKYFCALRNSHH